VHNKVLSNNSMFSPQLHRHLETTHSECTNKGNYFRVETWGTKKLLKPEYVWCGVLCNNLFGPHYWGTFNCSILQESSGKEINGALEVVPLATWKRMWLQYEHLRISVEQQQYFWWKMDRERWTGSLACLVFQYVSFCRVAWSQGCIMVVNQKQGITRGHRWSHHWHQKQTGAQAGQHSTAQRVATCMQSNVGHFEHVL
jgi:hypothetical protein